MISEKDKIVQGDEDLLDNSRFATKNDCQEKIDKCNEKLKNTADELEEISSLYAKSVKDRLDKAKKLKNLKKNLKS